MWQFVTDTVMTNRRRGDHILVPSLARGETIARAASQAGLSERTVYRRLHEPEFRAQVDGARAELFDQAAGRLAGAAEAATDCLIALLDAEAETVRLGAARALWNQLVRVREVSEFERRLETIEGTLQSSG